LFYCFSLLIPDALHEACSEHDLVRDQAVGAIATFLADPEGTVPLAQQVPVQIAPTWAVRSGIVRDIKMMPSYQTREEVLNKLLVVAAVFAMHLLWTRVFGGLRNASKSRAVQPAKKGKATL
jgi:hypothetical protein